MAIRELIERQGNWLFRWRSLLPIAAVPVVVVGLLQFTYPFGSHGLDLGWEAGCFLISLTGLSLRILTLGFTPKRTSGRNTKKGQVADHLNTTGMYSLVRHPLYLGNLLMALGPALFLREWWMAALFVIAFGLYYERIMFAEEEFLRRKFGAEYLAWAERTPLLLPGRGSWQTPSRAFDWKRAVRHEHHSLSNLVLAFAALEVGGDLVLEGALVVDPAWVATLAVTLALGGAIRVVSRYTNLLRSHE